ncbi:Permease OS=Castellaniella defragrans OX=75697 GN=HNR28_003561 PE=4 SV=1 [Castellaniella defragrans]
MQRALDFDKTPALAVPLPFLLNVPLFAGLAGALATWAGPAAFTSRWSPIALALTHLWTLGVLASAMLGALLQILAVACNVPTIHARGVSAFVHAALTAGTLLLAAGFVGGSPAAWRIAALLLGLAFAAYLLAAAGSLWRHRAQVYAGAREILVPVRGALIALAATVGVGLALLTFLSLGLAPPAWVGLHVLWGLLGWGGLLVMGMSFQLLPIFQATELYPRRLTRALPLAVFALLPAWSAATALRASPLPQLMELLLAGGYAAWGAITLQRLRTRKHPTDEATPLFWYAGMASLLACVALWLWFTLSPAAPVAMALGTLMIVGVLGSAINGMLYKIVPFLLWKHAQDALVVPDDNPAQVRLFLKVLPKMVRYIPARRARAQWAAHIAVVLSWTLAALGWHPAAYAAGPLLLLSAAGLAWNMGQALRLYRHTLRALAALTPHLPPSPPAR